MPCCFIRRSPAVLRWFGTGSDPFAITSASAAVYARPTESDFGDEAMNTVAWASAYCASGSPIQSSAWPAATATDSARGSAFPTSSDALMISRRAMNLGSSPAVIIAASQ